MKDLANSIVRGFDARARRGKSETLWNIRSGKHTVAEVIVRKAMIRVNFRDLPAGLPEGVAAKEAGNRKPSSRWACGILVKDKSQLGEVRSMIEAAVKAAPDKAKPAANPTPVPLGGSGST